jgi:hypothetical protein
MNHRKPRELCVSSINHYSWLGSCHGCTKVVAEPPLSTHEVHYDLLDNFYLSHLFIQQIGNTIVHKIYICHLY